MRKQEKWSRHAFTNTEEMSDNNNQIGHNTTSAGGNEESIMDVSAT